MFSKLATFPYIHWVGANGGAFDTITFDTFADV